ncbi:adenosine deaminase [Clostridiaceae bacterium DONG20-135]|uniref:Adenosine deaminase n=1 Tax=Copranaerobaculum intestinale TaxID=2692629 RepID=A0A6N8UE54_9FIRM|nr:adenosine deaminase [Copranaerobaculum intestinale]MXQ73677.1 adenosine deaminase [Copranaerobaculum intestinale]
MKAYSFPKFDLHLHLDGSLPCMTAWKLAKTRRPELLEQGYEAFRNRMQVHPNCHSLHEILDCFDLPLALLQDEEALFFCTKDLIKQLAESGVVYAEIRFAPQQHIKEGLTQRQVIEAVLSGVRQASKEFPQIEIQLITCMMVFPFDNDAENWETVQLCHEYLNRGVCALDIAGPEGVKPFSAYRPFFEKAKHFKIPFTIHAGENGPVEHIKEALEMGASRIGHGVSAIDDPKLLLRLKEQRIPLESCVRSNYVCEVIDNYKHHPIRSYFDQGLLVTVNTDDMTIIDSTLDQEYEILQKELYFSDRELLELCRNSVEAAFLKDDRKQYYLQLIDTWKNSGDH